MKAVNLELLLPADIPAGERILWHGRPQWLSLARRAFRGDFVAAYFGLMTIVNVVMAAAAGSLDDALISAVKTLAAGGLALGLLALLAWLSSRTTLYVVTSRRVTMKIGIALPIFFNLPFSSIASASLRQYADGTGEVPLALGPQAHIAYLHLWPHAKPFCSCAAAARAALRSGCDRSGGDIEPGADRRFQRKPKRGRLEGRDQPRADRYPENIVVTA